MVELPQPLPLDAHPHQTLTFRPQQPGFYTYSVSVPPEQAAGLILCPSSGLFKDVLRVDLLRTRPVCRPAQLTYSISGSSPSNQQVHATGSLDLLLTAPELSTARLEIFRNNQLFVTEQFLS
jgi:hypothetical protein